jgi:ABC-type multidrug transport system fused ATPase/permease subunit
MPRLRRGREPAQKSQLNLRGVIAPLTIGQRRRLAIVSVASILGGFAEAGLLVIFARVAFALAGDDAKVTFATGIFGTIHLSMTEVLVIAAVLAAIRMGLQWVAVVLSARAGSAVLLNIRRSLTTLFLDASWSLQSTQREGRLQEMISGYAQNGSGAILGLTQLITASFNLLALLVAAVVVEPVAAVVAAAAALGIGLLLRPLRAVVRRRTRDYADANLDLATGVTEFASTLQEVRIFGVQDQAADLLNTRARTVSDKLLRSAYITGGIPVLYQGFAMYLLVGALAVASGVGIGDLASLGAVMLIMLRSLSYAQAVQGNIQALHAVAPYLEALQEEEQLYRSAAVPHDGAPFSGIGEIAFQDVEFEYLPGQPVLKDITFSVPHGEIVGIVGPSGAGKSTLVQLLLRLREPTGGTITADGRPVDRLSINDWYDHVTFVSQDSHLFAGTVADNIRFFRDDVDHAAVERAARLAHIHDDIMSWPRGYETPVGERGGSLSGGQRQRLCIARALVGDPSVVLLDEPTSALDVRSEALMRDTMGELAPQKTVFVIAHRMSTLSICDRIMVILDGTLQGFDEPARLEQENPFYREALRLSGLR